MDVITQDSWCTTHKTSFVSGEQIVNTTINIVSNKYYRYYCHYHKSINGELLGVITIQDHDDWEKAKRAAYWEKLYENDIKPYIEMVAVILKSNKFRNCQYKDTEEAALNMFVTPIFSYEVAGLAGVLKVVDKMYIPTVIKDWQSLKRLLSPSFLHHISCKYDFYRLATNNKMSGRVILSAICRELENMGHGDFGVGSTKTFTYIITDSSGLYKIGKSIDVKKRLKQLHTGNPTIELKAVLEDDYENELHERYASKRVKGEWFRLSPSDIENIVNEYN